MSVFKKEDIRDWAVMFANRCRFTEPVYEPYSVEHGFKEGFRVAIEKMQANDDNAGYSGLHLQRVRLSCFKEVFEKFNTINEESEFYGWLYEKSHEA